MVITFPDKRDIHFVGKENTLQLTQCLFCDYQPEGKWEDWTKSTDVNCV